MLPAYPKAEKCIVKEKMNEKLKNYRTRNKIVKQSLTSLGDLYMLSISLHILSEAKRLSRLAKMVGVSPWGKVRGTPVYAHGDRAE